MENPNAGRGMGLNTNGRVAVAALGDGTIGGYRIADGKEILASSPFGPENWVLWTPSGSYDASRGVRISLAGRSTTAGSRLRTSSPFRVRSTFLPAGCGSTG